MLYVGGLVAVAALCALVLLVRFLGKRGTPRTVTWTLTFIAAAVLALVFLNVTSIFYTPPLLWTTLTSGAVLAAIVSFVFAGRTLGRNGSLLLGLAGVLVLSLFLATVLLMALPTGRFMTPLFETRAQQIGEAHGFEAILAPDETLVTDYGPVSGLEGDDGFSIEYQRFQMQEREAEGTLSEAELERIVAAGEDPLGWDRGIPEDATYEWFEVAGRPALGVEYNASGPLPKDQSVFRLLVFEKDGVDVRMVTEGRNEYKGERDGEEIYEYGPPLTFEELVRIAETLRPKAR